MVHGANSLPPPLGITDNIDVPENADGQPVTTWERLHFSPIGLYHLRCWQGVFPGIKDFFITCQRHFRSADIAWFASGMNSDGNHTHPPYSFHPSLVSLIKDSGGAQGKIERKALLAEVKEQLFDMATMYDRLTGSTTIVISSGGTTIPGSPARPEYLKANVYLPPAFVSHHPDLHPHLIDIVQHYIETVGVRTVTMWTKRARRDLGYSLTQVGNPRQNPHVNAIPNPDYNTAHYMFFGQPYRITADPSASPIRPPSPADSYAHAFDEDPDASTLTIIDLQQERNELHEKIHILQKKISHLEEENRASKLRNSSLAMRTRDRIRYLEGQIQRYAETTSTPVRNVTTKPANSNTPRTPLRYGSATPSRAAPTRTQNPQGSVYSSPVSRTLFSFSPAQTSPTASHAADSNTDVLAYPCESLLPHYITLYHLGHLSTSINLISNYTPLETCKEELLKLGLEEVVCDALAEAMALDRTLQHD